jgi:hypothetical protein
LPNFGRKRFNVASYGSGVFGYMWLKRLFSIYLIVILFIFFN